MSVKRVFLPQDQMPTQWYNPMPDLPTPLAPPLNPETMEPLTPDMLSPIFPDSLIAQEMSQDRFIDIPEEVLEVYKIWRPSPLVRADKLEKAIGAKCKIYYKDESGSPAGSHKPNTSVPQAYYNKMAGVKRLATETGAGQWGTALSFACAQFDMECVVYMVKVSYEQKPYRKMIINTYGGTIHASPSEQTRTGREMLAKDPNCKGSLGLAISEAVEDAATRDDTKYALGSVLNHVIIHQTITGLETQKQLEMIGEKATHLVGCVGGGSNFGGLVLPFLPQKLAGDPVRFIPVEPKACPTLTRGEYRYDFGDMARLTPLVKMHTLGHDFMPAPIHAGGLRYHGDAPIVCNIVEEGLCEPVAYFQTECFEAAKLFMQTEGFLPAPETSHAIKGAIEVAKTAGPDDVVVFLYSGHGMLDLASYDAFNQGLLTNFELPQRDIEEALKACPIIK